MMICTCFLAQSSDLVKLIGFNIDSNFLLLIMYELLKMLKHPKCAYSKMRYVSKNSKLADRVARTTKLDSLPSPVISYRYISMSLLLQFRAATQHAATLKLQDTVRWRLHGIAHQANDGDCKETAPPE